MDNLTKNQRWLILFPSIIFILVGIGIAVAYYAPLFGGVAPEGDSTDTPDSSKTTKTESVLEDEEVIDEEPELEEGDDEITQDDAESDCNGPESMSVLVLGIDAQAQSDAIRLVRLDFIRKKISVVSIPRDFYVPIVDMEEHGITEGRINATYGYGEKFLGESMGILSLSENLSYNFDVTFDRYVVLDFSNVSEYIDQIGGVDIRLDQPVTDGNLYFGIGDHHMDGNTAVSFMRMRYYDNDFARIGRQSLVFRAFYRKALSELNLIQLSQLAIKGLTDENIQTNFTNEDISPLICLAQLIDGYDVQFIEIPEEMYWPFTTPAGANVQIPYHGVSDFLQSVMDGTYQN